MLPLASLLDSCWQVAVRGVALLVQWWWKEKRGKNRQELSEEKWGWWVCATCPGAEPGEIPCNADPESLELEAQFPWLLYRQGRNGLASSMFSQRWHGDLEWQQLRCEASGNFLIEFGFCFSILQTHLHVPRYYKTLKVLKSWKLLVGNTNSVRRVVLALGWFPAWKCLSAIASPWCHYALASGFTKSWLVVCSYLKSLYVFCNETGIFDLEEAALGAAVTREKNPWQKPWPAVSLGSG